MWHVAFSSVHPIISVCMLSYLRPHMCKKKETTRKGLSGDERTRQAKATEIKGNIESCSILQGVYSGLTFKESAFVAGVMLSQK